MDAIFEVSEDDLHKAINTLQAATSLGETIEAEIVYSVTRRVNPINVREMMAFTMKGTSSVLGKS